MIFQTLRRADHSSRGVIMTVVCRCVWYRNLVNEEALPHWRLSRQKQTNKKKKESDISDSAVELVRNLVAHGDAREGKWRENWWMEWVASTLTPPPNVVYPALLKLMRTPRLPATRLNRRPHRFKWTRPFRGKTKSGFCPCAITFRTSYTYRTIILIYNYRLPLPVRWFIV